MADASPLFLRERELRRGIELMHAARLALSATGDDALAAAGLGRAHGRALYFVARQPDASVTQLMALLGITKQSLGRVLRDLGEQGLVATRAGRDDRRQRLVRLTEAGCALEAAVFERARGRLAAAYARAGPEAVAGFWTVLEQLAGSPALARMAAFRDEGADAGRR